MPDGRCRAPRYHSDGPRNAQCRWLGSHTKAQGQSANARHPRYRSLSARARRRARKGARGGVQRVRHQTDRIRSASRHAAARSRAPKVRRPDREALEVFMATDLPGILIVDDNEDNRYTLQLMLESDGHERITCATGGNEAIALIKKEKFSLVLLDLMMPDL